MWQWQVQAGTGRQWQAVHGRRFSVGVIIYELLAGNGMHPLVRRCRPACWMDGPVQCNKGAAADALACGLPRRQPACAAGAPVHCYVQVSPEQLDVCDEADRRGEMVPVRPPRGAPLRAAPRPTPPRAAPSCGGGGLGGAALTPIGRGPPPSAGQRRPMEVRGQQLRPPL